MSIAGSTSHYRAGRVTIITAAYNASATLDRCIRSVKQQDYADVEHVVVDGGSTDSSLSLLQGNGDSVRWISERDRGIYDAWNKGLMLATGEWIAFVGADDTLLPCSVRSYMELADLYPEADYLSAKVKWKISDQRSRMIGEPWSWPAFQRSMVTAHVGSMHRRRLFSRYGMYDTSYRFVGDYELLLRAGPELKTAYMPVLTAVMDAGGATDSFHSLQEARRAKIYTGGRGRFVATLEERVAAVKLLARRLQYRGAVSASHA